MNVAITRGKTVDGWMGARALLWHFMDQDTILIGHALNNDLQALRLMHARVLETALMTASVVFGTEGKGDMKRTWGLQDLCNEMLSIHIRSAEHSHDCFEDVLATREVALCCLEYPELLDRWGERRWRDFHLEMVRRYDGPSGEWMQPDRPRYTPGSQKVREDRVDKAYDLLSEEQEKDIRCWLGVLQPVAPPVSPSLDPGHEELAWDFDDQNFDFDRNVFEL